MDHDSGILRTLYTTIEIITSSVKMSRSDVGYINEKKKNSDLACLDDKIQ